MASKSQPVIEEIYIPWSPRKLPVPFLAGFTQATSPWSFPKTIKFQPPIPEPDLTQPSGRRAIPFTYTNGVNPNASPWQPFAQRFMPAPVEIPPTMGVTEPGRRYSTEATGAFVKQRPGKRIQLVPWDHTQEKPVRRRHEQLVAQILNTLITSGDIDHDPGVPQAPWRLSYDPAVSTNWSSGPLPATIREAIDRIVAVLAALGHAP